MVSLRCFSSVTASAGAPRTARFHLDEHDEVTVSGDQVDLTPKGVIPARHDPHAGSPQVTGGGALATIAEESIPKMRYEQSHEL